MFALLLLAVTGAWAKGDLHLYADVKGTEMMLMYGEVSGDEPYYGADTYETQWDGKHRLLHLRFENKPEGVKVCIRW
ncbi:MAG: hypothetical protein IJ615_00565 [Bacteroidaceae bacterium]|nr:hypothetical protein [Bacteroidaceae bacterium]